MDHLDPFESDEDFVGTLLREAAFEEEPDWAQFGAGVMARLDADEHPEPERVLRVDEVDPEEAADAVLFFASPWSRAVTGQNLTVDGGLVFG